MRKFLIVIFFVCSKSIIFSQDRFAIIEKQLSDLSATSTPGLKEKADIYLSKTSLQIFFAGLAKSYKLNLSVDPSLDIPLSMSFTQESVQNILLYTCRKYSLDYQFTGSIISVSKFKEPVAVVPEKEPSVKYDRIRGTLTLDLKNDSLSKVVKQITQLTGKNVFSSSELSGKLVTLYVQELRLPLALEKLAQANDIELTDNLDSTYQLSLKPVGSNSTSPNKSKS
jgi:type IV pilus assembly protein PilQ